MHGLNPRQSTSIRGAQRLGLYNGYLGVSPLMSMARARHLRVAPAVQRQATLNTMGAQQNNYAMLGQLLMALQRRM